jgi:hypothetical protein
MNHLAVSLARYSAITPLDTPAQQVLVSLRQSTINRCSGKVVRYTPWDHYLPSQLRNSYMHGYCAAESSYLFEGKSSLASRLIVMGNSAPRPALMSHLHKEKFHRTLWRQRPSGVYHMQRDRRSKPTELHTIVVIILTCGSAFAGQASHVRNLVQMLSIIAQQRTILPTHALSSHHRPQATGDV